MIEPQRWAEVEKLYNDLMDLDPAERDVRLAAISDPDLRREVLSLLQAGPFSPTLGAWLQAGRDHLMGQHGVSEPASGVSHNFKPGDVLASRYQITEFLGRGGMGEVYAAEDRDLAEKIAIKVIRRETAQDKSWCERFRREVQLARRVTHPNVCRVFDLERHQQDGQEVFFLTMELVRGETLAAHLERQGRLSLMEALPAAVQLCAALETAHRAGILHRDLKCGNIMMVGTGEQIRTVVTDFGTARVIDLASNSLPTGTLQSAIVGTPAYMSPEQLEGKELTAASDIYSLGLVLYEMVTGVRPFHAESPWAEAMKRFKEDPEPPAKILPEIGENWNSTILRCLERDPAKRFSSAQEVSHSLQSAGLTQRPRLLRKLAAVGVVVMAALLGIFLFRGRLFSPALPATRHVAVLPFAFAGNDASTKAMVDGLAESLTANLTQLQASNTGLWVVPWKNVQERPVADEKRAALALGVNLLLTGEVEKRGNELWLHAGLKDANTLQVLRSQTIRLPQGRTVTIKDVLLEQVCAMLRLHLAQATSQRSPPDETMQPGAYEFYLQGKGYLQHRDSENVDRAISLFQKSLQKDPNFALAYADLAFAYVWKYDDSKDQLWIGKASQSCAKALALSDALAPAHLALGVIDEDTGNLEKAITEYEQALELDPSNDEARSRLSLAYNDAGKVLEAEALLKDGAQRNPASWVNYDFLGYFYYQHAEYGKAEGAFQIAAELAPDNPTAFSNLGGIYLTLNRYTEAEEMLRKAIAVKPTARAYANLGTAFQGEGRLQDSAAMYEKATEMAPADHRVWYGLGNADDLLSDHRRAVENYEKAIAAAEKGLAVNPDDNELWESLAFYYALVGQKDKARQALARVTPPFSNSPETLFQSAKVYELLGQRELALNAMRSALLAGFPLGQIEDFATSHNLQADKRFAEIVKIGQRSTPH